VVFCSASATVSSHDAESATLRTTRLFCQEFAVEVAVEAMSSISILAFDTVS
jgi:hypothetical protein